MKTLWQIIITLTLILLPHTLRAAEPEALPETPADTEITTLNNVEVESDAALSIVAVKLNLKPRWRKLDSEDHGSFVQVLLPGTIIPKPGTFYDGAGPYIKKVAAFQVTPSDGAIRLFTSTEAAKVRAATSAEVLGDRVIITVDHKKLAGLLPTQASPKVAGIDPDMLPAFDKIKVPTADHVVATTPIRTDIPSPAEQLKTLPTSENVDLAEKATIPSLTPVEPAATGTLTKPAETNPSVGQNVPDLSKKLSGVAVFSAIMLILFGGLYFLKPMLRRRALASNHSDLIKMKTLATMPLAGKQKLALVQVAGQQILLAISPDNVNFITTIGPTSGSASETNTTRALPPAALAPAQATFAPTKARMPLPKTEPRGQFSTQLLNADDDSSIELRRAQTVSRKTQAAAPKSPQPPQRKSINIAIGDEGIKRMGSGQRNSNPRMTNAGVEGDKPLEDITRLIREKLKNLPAI